ncbi:hypothetical protein [Roseivirga sp. E12]|uniref:hypothetical protein n=1 Tax=Roseivirga sp. E12 TaxID=2819237 RepID=UPI001ABCDDF0|nr:hypothetical protein [Roseivirga sp. E12]MBO3698862.1 hypothetical protein [Roseivirga sp. E12]
MRDIQTSCRIKNAVVIVLIVISAFGTSSCGSSESGSKANVPTEINYVAQITDSVVVDRLSVLTMEAINPAGNRLLLVDEQTNEMVLVNESGEITSSFNPFVEGPDYMGDKSFGWTFYGNDQLVGFGYTHFVRFSDKGKRLQRLSYPIEVAGWIYMDYFPKRLIYYKDQSTEKVVALIPGLSKPSPRTQLYYDSLDLVYALDFTNETSRPIFRRPEESIYRTLGKYIDNGYPSMDHLNNGKFVVAYTSDKNIYIYDAPSDELLNILEIPEEHRPEFDAIEFSSKGKVDRTKSVGYVMTIGDKIAVMMMGRVPESELEKIMGIPQWWQSPEFDQLNNKYGSTNLLLFNEQEYLGEVDWDFESSDYRFFGDANGYIWLKRAYEDERDYQTFLKVRIVPETN